jgi:hypothetical protein
MTCELKINDRQNKNKEQKSYLKKKVSGVMLKLAELFDPQTVRPLLSQGVLWQYLLSLNETMIKLAKNNRFQNIKEAESLSM